MTEFTSPIDTGNVLRAQTEGRGRVVTDKSAEILAGAASQAIKAGAGVAKAKAVGEFESILEPAADEFSEARNMAAGAELEQRFRDATDNLAVADLSGDDAVVNKHRNELNRLKRLRSTGAISVSQFKIAAEAFTRTAKNESPFFGEEIVASRNAILDLHAEEFKAFDAADKARKAETDYLLKQLTPIYIAAGNNPIGVSVEEMAPVVARYTGDKAAYDKAVRGEKLDEIAANKGFYGEDNNYRNGETATLKSELDDTLKSFRAGDIKSQEEYEKQVNLLIQEHTLTLQQLAVGVSPDHVNSTTAAWAKIGQTYIDGVKNNKSTEWIENQRKIKESGLALEFLDNKDLATAWTIDSMIPNHLQLPIFFEGPLGDTLASKVMRGSQLLTGGGYTTSAADPTPTGRQASLHIGRAIDSAYTNNYPETQEDRDNLHKMGAAMADILLIRPVTGEEKQGFLTMISNPKIADVASQEPTFKQHSATHREAMFKIIKQDIAPSIRTSINEAFISTVQGQVGRVGTFRDLMELEISDSGLVSVQIKDTPMSPTEKDRVTRMVMKMNRSSILDLNKIIQGVSHINGNKDYLSSAQTVLGKLLTIELPDIVGNVESEEEEPAADED